MLGKRGKIILIALFMLALVLPLAGMLSGQKQQYSTNEKRPLARPPVFQLSDPARLSRETERFFNDHFGFRDYLIHWFHRLQVQWLDVSTSGRVLKGKEGWLYQTGDPHFDEMRNVWPFTPWELKRWADGLQAKHEALKARGVEYLFLVAANKPLIYPEYLPKSVRISHRKPRSQQLVEYLEEHTDVNVLYLKPPLLDAKSRVGLPLYHKTDTHWNLFGAYIGYATLIEHLGNRFPDLPRVELAVDDFEIVPHPGGDLARNLNLSQVLPEHAVVPRDWEPECASYSGVKAGADRERKNQRPFTTTCDQGSARVLMLRDSYTLDLMPYLSETFEYIHYYPATPRPLEVILPLVEEHDPEIVIEQRASRWLRTPFG